MKRILILLTFFCINTFNSFSQKPDNKSLIDFKKQRNELERLVNHFPDSALLVAKNLLAQAKKSGSEKQKAVAYCGYGFVQLQQTNLEVAETWLKKALKINQTLKQEDEIAYNYAYLAMIGQRKSDYVVATKYFFKSLDLAKKQDNFNLLQRNYSGIAFMYLDQDNHKKSLFYAKKAVELIDKNNNESRNAQSYAVLAEVYREMGNIELADVYFAKSYRKYLDNKDPFGQAYCLTNWSLIFDTKEIVKSIEMELTAQKIWDELYPDNLMSMTNLGNLGWSYYILAENKDSIPIISNPAFRKSKSELLLEAEKYYKRCIEIAQRKKNANTELFFSGSLSQMLADRGDFKEAYTYLLQNKTISDSIFSQDNKNAIAQLESEGALREKQNQLEIKELKLTNASKQRWFLVGGLMLLAIIGALLFRQSQARKKTNALLQKSNTDLAHANAAKAKLFGIINHDLRSPVASLVNFLNLQQLQPGLMDEETKQRLFSQTLSSTQNLLVSMEDLLLWSKGQLDNFQPTKEKFEIQSLFDTTKQFFQGVNVKLVFENPDNLILHSDEHYLKTILRNLTANAIKAVAHLESPAIKWSAQRINGRIILSITDNGPGMKPEQMKVLFDDSETAGINKGLGLHIVRDMAKSIDCEIVWDENFRSGTKFSLIL